MATNIFDNPDLLPQPIGEYRPLDEWQMHVNTIFYGLHGERLRDFYQTFASADYRLAHALAADYFAQVTKRENVRRATCEVEPGDALSEVEDAPRTSHLAPRTDQLTVVELGPGNGNLAACFLSHLKHLDTDGRIYPRIRYLLVDSQASTIERARRHPDLADHQTKVDTLVALADSLTGVGDGTVDLIICNELWNELPTKLMLRTGGDIEEEFVRPNLNEKRHAEIADWPGFVKAFDLGDIEGLRTFPFALEDIVWEREYRKAEGKSLPYRKTITDFLKQIDEKVLVPINLGAMATLKEAKRVLAPEAVGLSGFDAGTSELTVLNDPEKPCYGQHGGQFSFMVNFALLEAVAKQIGMRAVNTESQREFVGRSLGTNVLGLMDVLAMHPSAPSLPPGKQDRLVLQTIRALNEVYRSPYRRTFDFPLRADLPPDERESLQNLLASLPAEGIPDTVAYLTEDELERSLRSLDLLGYETEFVKIALGAPPNPVEYCHFACRPT